MIYDFPELSSPISQGDIFIGVPILDLPEDELLVTDDKGSVQMLPWEEFASEGEKVSAIIAVRPTIAIVGTQECDALRAPNITLFEVRPFRDVERKSKDTSKPSKWVPIITQHTRINQKWFYLPADERVGFSEKMGADFLTPIRIPRIALERLISFRKGRLNEVARQHFRERLAEFFRRYAYDEWYPLTQEELAEYQKNHPDAEPFPWQHENHVSDDRKRDEEVGVGEISEDYSEKGLLAYLAVGKKAADELTAILSTIDTEIRNLSAKLNQQMVASNMSTFSKLVEDLLPKFEENIRELEESISAYVALAEPESKRNVGHVLILRNSLTQILNAVRPSKDSVRRFRDNTLSIRNQNLSEELNSAASRQSQALDGVISNMEHVESFALRVIFLIDEKFGKPPASEDVD